MGLPTWPQVVGLFTGWLGASRAGVPAKQTKLPGFYDLTLEVAEPHSTNGGNQNPPRPEERQPDINPPLNGRSVQSGATL